MVRGVIFFLGVNFYILFLNFDVFPVKAQKGNSVELQLITPVESRLAQHLDPAPILSPQQKVEQQAPIQRNITPNTIEKTEYPLFRLTTNPLVPSYIIQGNYVINATSPSKDYIAYLYPDEWETIGDIYLKDTVYNIWTRLQLDQQLRREMWNSQEAAQEKYTPKKRLLWLNNEEFLTIIGYAQGTVSTGGDLLKVNRVTGEAEMIYPAYQKLNQEVTDIEIVGEKLNLQINVTDASGLSLEQGVISASLTNLTTLAEQEPVSDKSTIRTK